LGSESISFGAQQGFSIILRNILGVITILLAFPGVPKRHGGSAKAFPAPGPAEPVAHDSGARAAQRSVDKVAPNLL
jgi:hypothetical protein